LRRKLLSRQETERRRCLQCSVRLLPVHVFLLGRSWILCSQ
jgi:hypothetical protein